MSDKTEQHQVYVNDKSETPAAHPLIAKLDDMRDTLINRLGKGESPFDVATSIEVPFEYLCAWMTRKDVVHAFKTITKATQLHVQMVVNQFHSSAVGRLAQIALETEGTGSFESASAARMVDIARKACVDLLRFKTRVFDPPGSYNKRTDNKKKRQRSGYHSRYHSHQQHRDIYSDCVDYEDEFDGCGELPEFDPENPLAPFDILNSAPPSDEPPTSDAVLVALDWMNRSVDPAERDELDNFVVCESEDRDQKSEFT